MQGLAALAQGNFTAALAAFQSLDEAHAEPAVRYNIAYANAMLGRFDEAVAELEDRVLDALPCAATLKLRALHHLGRIDEAIALGEHYAQSPDCDPELHAALATALFDTENLDGARVHAARAPETPDGFTVRGLLALDEGSAGTAHDLFERALALNANSGRAMLGAGLALLSQQRFAAAAPTLDRAAELLKSHAGSWVSAGWAHLFNGELATARVRFEHAAQIDRGFAEAPGGLAVVDFHEGRFDEAERNARIALRLDGACLSAALAQSLLAEHAGLEQTAADIRQAALNRPIGADGQTLARALARRSSRLNHDNGAGLD
ncbi:tetratricopeptide repeat protein [Trinickia terrae]|uniref:tetratricopeptide repeat protein n=1 Tax=Trinickia terrae TaxID=2571161 RepID=UPI00146DDDCC|nr:tetratricopeptide repeat protein [Trinickia terrae]